MKVGLFIPCYINAVYPEVGRASCELLRRVGCDVDYPLDQTCCGQPMANAGFERDAKALAERQLIARQAHAVDGRSHHLELTDTGRSLYDAIVPAALASEAQLESNISADERTAMMAILAKLTAAAEDYA